MFDVTLLDQEVQFRFSRSQGKGGQHVNKVATRAELLFDLEASQLLSEEQKELLREKWGNRLSQEGILTVGSQEFRSQWQNRQAALLKFHDLLSQAFRPEKKRRATRTPRSAHAKRLDQKRQQAEKKSQRRKVFIRPEEDLSTTSQ
ncbi:MAG: aminoacyl-tRNA hydrolase [Saprospiraceae bacterium]|nr:aminoacyl-tRNA hydrolase [Saprospiraceae bacterium]MCB0627402.1 aminoacyl-tRNA hydrolase [Saprospiraceae bacterium]MCB0684347.1 aminoacyl-tRNA hydrolase [Saprospiraceae bacterium]